MLLVLQAQQNLFKLMRAHFDARTGNQLPVLAIHALQRAVGEEHRTAALLSNQAGLLPPMQGSTAQANSARCAAHPALPPFPVHAAGAGA